MSFMYYYNTFITSDKSVIVLLYYWIESGNFLRLISNFSDNVNSYSDLIVVRQALYLTKFFIITFNSRLKEMFKCFSE